MGGLRAYLQRIVPDYLRERAFTLDATLLELEWMTAPAIVAVTGFLGAPVLAVVLMALATLGALGGTRLLSRQEPTSHPAGTNGAWRIRSALPTYVFSAVVGYTEGTINIALAPLMLVMGSRPATAGFLISLLSVTSAVGGVGYALLEGRRPGDPNERSNIALLALGLGMVLTAVAPSLIVLIVAIALCGVWFAPIVAMRNVILAKLLPESQLSEGFSTLTAAGQFGYGMSGVATGIVLGFIGVRACFVLAATITVVSGLVAWSWHHFSRGSQVTTRNG
jgi:predicted MFS family arabinose efflux permease